MQKKSMRFPLLPALMAACLIAYVPHAAHAVDDDYFDLPPELLLNAQVISATKRSGGTVADTPAAIFVVTAEDIQRSGVTTIPDALRMAPGVHVAQADSNSAAVSIRGFNSVLANKLLVMIDGRTIYNPVFGGTFWEAHDLMMEDIERIEIVRGPGGTLWGANAVQGVINIITKHARETQGNLASALYGNEEEGTFNFRHGGTFGDDTFYRLYAKTFQRDAYRDPDGGDAYDSWAGYRAGFRMDGDTDWADEFTVQGDIYRTREDQFRTEAFLAGPPFTLLRNQDLIYSGANILGRWTDKRDDGSQLSLQTYLDWTQRDEPYNFVDNRLIFDLEGQYNLPTRGRHEIIVGAGYRLTGSDEEGAGLIRFDPDKRRDNLYNAFIQDRITLEPDRWFLTLGSKFEINDYSGLEIQPNVRLQFHPDENQTWWAAVSRAVRTPTQIEQDLIAISNALSIAGTTYTAGFVLNKDFKPEELTAYEIGYRNQITPALSVDIATFYNQYDNLTSISALAPFGVNNGVDPAFTFLIPLQFRNDMEGQSWGFELASDWMVRPDLKLSATYSFMQMLMNAPTAAGESAEDSYPAHQAGLRASWTINGEWSLDAGAAFVDGLENGNVDDYVRVDVNLGWKLQDNVRFNLIAQNLTTDSHREFGAITDINAAEVERSVFGKLTWEF